MQPDAQSEVIRPVPGPATAAAVPAATQLAGKSSAASKASPNPGPNSKSGKAAAEAATRTSSESLAGKASSKLPVTVRTSDDPSDRASQEWRLKPGHEEVWVPKLLMLMCSIQRCQAS